MILGSAYNTYEEALEELHMKTLSARRKELALKFTKKASEHPIHQSWFSQNPEESYTRLKKADIQASVLENQQIPEVSHTNLDKPTK